jgi:hypothetical protein
MKKIFIILLAVAPIACTNEGSTDTNRTDSATIKKDNTINRDTGINSSDTVKLVDSVR